MNGNGTKNGTSSPKKETKVHIGDPYDEYFVPVNEHRKYMRYGCFTRTISDFNCNPPASPTNQMEVS